MLPIMTSDEDVRAIIDYLKTKATGATVEEAKAAINKKYLDNRKLSAYERWNLVKKEGDKVKLTKRGRNFARADEEGKQEIYSEIIREIKPYSMAVEWAYHQKFDEITNVDLAAHWHDHCKEELGTDNEKTINYQVVCFFSIAEAAGLGDYTVGRKGNPTRLSLHSGALSQFISEKQIFGDTKKDEKEIEQEEELAEPLHDEIEQNDTEDELEIEEKDPKEASRVFISHSKNTDIVDQIKTMLELYDIEYEIAVEEETTAIPVPEKVMNAMRSCNSAVICITADEQTKKDDGSFAVNENVLIEIGAAFVLYDKKVVLVWDKRISVPSNLQGLYRSEFEGDELSWSNGMKLMKALRGFRKE